MFFRGIIARVLHLGNRAFYSPDSDTITLPPFPAFYTAMEYYGTRAHSIFGNLELKEMTGLRAL
jgi:antirestriction protein ArdC